MMSFYDLKISSKSFFIFLLFLKLVFLLPVAYAEEKIEACNQLHENSLEAFPIILKATKTKNGNIEIIKRYKGYKDKDYLYPNRLLKEIDEEENFLLLAYLSEKKIDLSNCNHILYMKNLVSDEKLQNIIFDATLYQAKIDKKLNSFATIKPSEKSQRMEYTYYNNIVSFLKKHNDPLLLQEFIKNVLLNARSHKVENKNPYTIKNRQRSYIICDGDIPAIKSSKEVNAIIDRLSLVGSSGNTTILHDAKLIYAENLVQQNLYKDAIIFICNQRLEGRIPGVFMKAAVSAGYPELLNGKVFKDPSTGVAVNLEDTNLSGLHLKNIKTGKTWTNINVKDTDFTNANFIGTVFENVNLEDAKTYWATYDCNTQFPNGFDPIANNMIYSNGQYFNNSCDPNETRIFNLDNIEVKNFYQNGGQYDTVTLHRPRLINGSAKNSKLGKVVCRYGCDIENSDFSNSQIEISTANSSIRDTLFINANLSGSRFSNISFIDVDFTETNLNDVRFTSSRYDNQTKWPKGFDPQNNGLTLIGDRK